MSLDAVLEAAAILGTLGPSTSRGPSHSADVLRAYDRIDRELVAKGFPPTSAFWRETVRRWYGADVRQLVARVGRRGGKSSSLSRLGVVEALHGHHDVPPGDIGVVAIISTRRDEAAQRLGTVTQILDALGVPYKPWGNGVMGVKLTDRRVGFRVYAASVQGVSGFTAIFVICDEVAKWRDADTGQNPATEVLKSVRPTMATMPHARIVLSSSPFSTLDAHYDAFEAGDTDHQVTAYAPTWLANPTLTEDGTRGDEPDEGAWLREYKAVPQAEVEWSLLTQEQVDRAAEGRTLLVLPFDPTWRYCAAIDPATKTNSWTLAVAGQSPDGRRHVVLAKDWTPRRGSPLVPEDVLRQIRKLIAPYGLRSVVTDQHATEFLRAILRLMPVEDRISLIEEPWTQNTRRDGYEHLLVLAQSNRLGLPPDAQVKADLLGITKRITRSGVTYELVERNGRHADYAPAIAHAVADARYAGKLPPKKLDDDEREAVAKAAFLRGREKDRERAKRLGAMPVTHSKLRGRK